MRARTHTRAHTVPAEFSQRGPITMIIATINRGEKRWTGGKRRFGSLVVWNEPWFPLRPGPASATYPLPCHLRLRSCHMTHPARLTLNSTPGCYRRGDARAVRGALGEDPGARANFRCDASVDERAIDSGPQGTNRQLDRRLVSLAAPACEGSPC